MAKDKASAADISRIDGLEFSGFQRHTSGHDLLFLLPALRFPIHLLLGIKATWSYCYSTTPEDKATNVHPLPLCRVYTLSALTIHTLGIKLGAPKHVTSCRGSSRMHTESSTSTRTHNLRSRKEYNAVSI